MGIRFFATVVWPCAEKDRRIDNGGNQVVIDGPGLAHHIMGLCKKKHDPPTPFFQPSRQELARTVIDWLDVLERLGIKVEEQCRPKRAAIYIDGLLPRRKADERMKRTYKSCHSMLNYYKTYRTSGVAVTAPASEHHVQGTSASERGKFLFTARTDSRLDPDYERLPSLDAFGIEAIYEAILLSSRYGPITYVVPEEADIYCADALRRAEGGGIVLTSDSDLLLFNLGPLSTVAMFPNLDFVVQGGEEALLARVHSPAEVAQKLKIPVKEGILAFAFELSLIHTGWHITEDLKNKARTTVSFRDRPKQYEEFKKQYELMPPDPSPHSGSRHLADLACTQKLDRKVCEFVLDFLETEPKNKALPASFRFPGATIFFLPLLLDSQSRKSAWQTSYRIRLLAYQLLNLVRTPALLEVRELRRMDTLFNRGTPLSLTDADKSDEPTRCKAMAEIIRKIRRGLIQSDNRCDLTWTVMSMHDDIKWSEKKPLSLEILGPPTDADGTLRDCGSWDALHFLAQIQGTIYSLRILAQILQLTKGRLPETVASPAGHLAMQLRRLPRFRDFPTVHDLADLPRRLRDAQGLTVLEKIADLSPPISLGKLRKDAEEEK